MKVNNHAAQRDFRSLNPLAVTSASLSSSLPIGTLGLPFLAGLARVGAEFEILFGCFCVLKALIK